MNALMSISPYFHLGLLAVILIIIIAIYRNHVLTSVIAFLGLLFSFSMLFNTAFGLPVWAESMIVNDSFAIYCQAIIHIGALLLIPFAFYYFNKRNEQSEEFYILLVTSVIGAILMASAKNMIALFLGLEVLSIPLYAMIAYNRNSKACIQAAIKYIVLATIASSVFLFGFAMLYGWGGSMDLMVLTQKLTKQTLTLIPIMGLALVVIAFGFKMALAPFHIWTPDVYQGSPAPTTAFIASVSKVGAFAFIVRYLSAIQLNASSNLMFILIVLAVLSMFVGNLLAMRQSSVKRLLAGSSIAHMGYLLTAVLAGGIIGKSAATFYITIYVISSVGIFGILSIIGYSNYEIDKIDDLKGLFYNRPWIAVVLTTLFLSLAGVPLTAGFLAKFYVVMAGASVTQWMLVVVLIVNSIIALYYYLKVIASMFISHETNVAFPSAQFATTVAVSFIFIVIIWLGIMPSAIMEIITKVLAGI